MSWGSLLNTADLQLIEDSLCGMATIVVAAADVTLSQNNGATDQARMAILSLTGSPVAPHNINIPATTKQRSEEHTSELQSQSNLVCRLLLEKKKKINRDILNANNTDTI